MHGPKESWFIPIKQFSNELTYIRQHLLTVLQPNCLLLWRATRISKFPSFLSHFCFLEYSIENTEEQGIDFFFVLNIIANEKRTAVTHTTRAHLKNTMVFYYRYNFKTLGKGTTLNKIKLVLFKNNQCFW